TAAWEAPVAGVTDHGDLTGLADDDHTQYLNTARHETAHASGRWELLANQGTTHNTTVAVVWNNVIFENDPDNVFTMNTLTGGLTINEAGVYQISVGIDWEPASDTNARILFLRLNGSAIAGARQLASSNSTQNVLTISELAANDVIDIGVSQQSGGALDVRANSRTNLCILRLRGPSA